MNVLHYLRCLIAVKCLLWLAACATIPEKPAVEHWEHIGTYSGDTRGYHGRFDAYVDTGSIRKKGHSVTFRDKKVVQQTDAERYVTLPFKTAVGVWEMHCAEKTYRLNAVQLLDENGNVLLSETTLVPYMDIIDGSVNERQFVMVCGKPV